MDPCFILLDFNKKNRSEGGTYHNWGSDSFQLNECGTKTISNLPGSLLEKQKQTAAPGSNIAASAFRKWAKTSSGIEAVKFKRHYHNRALTVAGQPLVEGLGVHAPGGDALADALTHY